MYGHARVDRLVKLWCRQTKIDAQYEIAASGASSLVCAHNCRNGCKHIVHKHLSS